MDYNNIYRENDNIDKETAEKLIDKLSENDKFKKMFSDMDTTYDEKRLNESWDAYLQDNHEHVFESSIVDKPEFIIKQEETKKAQLKGKKINMLPKPLKDNLMVKVLITKKTNSDIILNTDELKREDNVGIVIDSGKNSEITNGDKILFKPKSEIYRLNYNGELYFILNIKDVLGIY